MAGKYGKRPKRELTEKEKRAALRVGAEKNIATKKVKTPKKPGLISGMTPQQAKRFMWGGMAFCVAFIVLATVILVNMYTITTRATKIDLYAEQIAFDDLMQLHRDIQDKYHFTAMVDPMPVMNEVDEFNFRLIDFLLHEEMNRHFALSAADDFRRADFHAVGADEATYILLNELEDFAVGVYYESGSDGFVITIDGTRFEVDGVGGADFVIYTAPIGEQRNSLILAANGPAFHSTRTFVYYHDGEEVHFAGELPVGAMDVVVTNQGSLGVRGQPSVFFDWRVNEIWVMDDQHTFAPSPDPLVLDLTVPLNLFVRQPFTVFSEPDVDSITDVLPAMIAIEIVGTNERNFVRARAGTTPFYIHFPEPATINSNDNHFAARDLLFNLPN